MHVHLRSPSLDLALTGNCAISSLVEQSGDIVWCCMPRFDGDPVFHALLGSASDPDDGRLSVQLENTVRCEQAYVPGTAVLRTRL